MARSVTFAAVTGREPGSEHGASCVGDEAHPLPAASSARAVGSAPWPVRCGSARPPQTWCENGLSWLCGTRGGAERVYGVSPQRLCRWGDFSGRREAGQGQAVLEQRCLGARRGSRAAGGEGLGSIRLLGQAVRAPGDVQEAFPSRGAHPKPRCIIRAALLPPSPALTAGARGSEPQRLMQPQGVNVTNEQIASCLGEPNPSRLGTGI